MEINNGNKKGLMTLVVTNTLLLLGILASVLLQWQPWDPAVSANTRKITVTGTALTEATPDQYQFSPIWTRDTTAEITALNDQIMTKLKELGVKDTQIKNNASRYGSPEVFYSAPADGKQKTTLSITITVKDKDLAQKIQNYLLTTDPSGSITPYPSFSSPKQKELQVKLRAEATKDAKQKAEQTAEGLGAKVGRVIEISEGASEGFYPMPIAVSDTSAVSSSKDSISIQPGSDEYSYSVTAIFTLQ